MLTNTCKVLAKHWVSRHHFYVLLVYIYNKVFIQASGLACKVCVEVSLLRFLPITVCRIADSVV